LLPNLEQATPEMAPVASSLIYLTMGKMGDYLFGSGIPNNPQNTLKNLFKLKTNRFSYQFTEVMVLSGKVSGLVVSYSGRMMKSLELPMALHLLQTSGIFGFLRFIRRAKPLIGIKEVENDEFFISNLAVLPDYQGKGLGKALLNQAEVKAKELGLHKLSLTVDVENDRAISLYKKIGFTLVETVEINFLKKKIGYGGFHRMLKILK